MPAPTTAKMTASSISGSPGHGAAGEQESKDETERGRQQPRAKTAETGGAKDGGNEDEEGAPVAKPGVKAPGQHEHDRNARRRRNIMCARDVWVEEA